MKQADTLHPATKAGYGAAEFGLTATELMLRLYLLIFYTDVVGLTPALAGLGVALGIVWDAVTDPLMGYVSDRTASPMGQRRPYILAGSLLLAATLVMIFSPPTFSSQFSRFLFLLLSYLLLNTALTIIAVPHGALGGELTDDRGATTSIYAWRMLFGNLGAIAGTVIPGYYLSSLADSASGPELQAQALTSSTYVLAAAVVITALITVVATRHCQRAAPATTPGASFFKDLSSLIQDRQLRQLVVAYVIATIGVALNSSLALYYYRYRLQFTEQQTQLVVAFFIVVFSLALVGWVLASRRIEKRKLLVIGVSLLGLMSMVVYPLLPPHELLGPLLCGVFGGIFVGAVVLLDVMLVDLADASEKRTGQRRLGMFFGLWKMSGKLSRALAVGISGVLLSAIGFVPNAVQSDQTSWLLGLAFGPGVGVFFLVGAWVMRKDP